MENVNAILAVGLNGEIGVGNELAWWIKEDMDFFKVKTSNSVVVMGSNTFDSLKVKPLPNRKNFVLSNNPEKYSLFNGVSSITSITDAIDYARKNSKELFIIGGKSVYESSLHYCDNVYLTVIHDTKSEANVFIDLSKFNIIEWKVHGEFTVPCEPKITIMKLTRRKYDV